MKKILIGITLLSGIVFAANEYKQPNPSTFYSTVKIPQLNATGIVTNTSAGVLGTTPQVSLTRGGTNTALTAVNGGMVWSDSSGMQITLAGTSGQLLTSGGAATPTWGFPSVGSIASTVAGGIVWSDSTKLNVLAAGTSGQFLTSGGAATPTWGSTLAIARGGTNSSSAAVVGGVVYTDATKYNVLAAGTSGQVLTSTGAGTPAWGSSGAANQDSWSGYHANNCQWSRTNIAFGDPATDASCTLTEVTNNNFGTVSSNGGASALPGIVFTPTATGYYYLCAIGGYQNSGTSVKALKLWDGTTSIAEQEVVMASANLNSIFTLCGMYNATSTAAKTLTIQIKSPSGATTIVPLSEVRGVIEWSIFKTK